MTETIEDIIDAIRKSTKKSVASITARRLEYHGGRDCCAVDDAITCLRDDDRFLRDIANRLKRAIQRERKARVKRNCDRFDDPNAAVLAYADFVRKIRYNVEGERMDWNVEVDYGPFSWLFAPAEKGGAK